MKYLIMFAIIVIAAAVLLAPLATDKEAQAERARAARIAEEARLEQARAETVTAKADAFGLKTMAMLPWGLLIVAVMFVGSLIVIMVLRPTGNIASTMAQMPPQIPGQLPNYYLQRPDESPEMFLLRVSEQVRQIEAAKTAR